MLYIDPTPNPSGAYPNPKNQSFPGCIILNDDQANVFFQYNGFVTVTARSDGVAQSVEPNQEAYEAWKSSLPTDSETPEPSETEQLRADVDYIAIMTGVELL